MRFTAISTSGAMCSWSSGSESKQNDSGMPFMPHGLATGSNQPTSSLPASSLKYAQLSGSRSTGMEGEMPSTASVTM